MAADEEVRAGTAPDPVLRIPTTALVLLVGPSSAGKSTWAGRRFRPEQIVSSDDLRAAVGESAHDQRASGDAFEVLERIVTARLGRRLLTVVDTLGMDADRRAGWIRRARERDMPVVAVRFTTTPAALRRRNKARDVSLPAAVLNRQIRGMEVTTADLLLAEGIDRVVELAGDDDRPVVLTAPSLITAAAAADRQRQEPLPMHIGLQIGRFDPPAGELAGHLVAVARAAEEAGLDSLWVMDHVIQIPQVGREWEDMLESWTTLGFLAQATSRIRLGTLVTGITYRNLAHLAKIVATVDVLSGGRVVCGLGAAWFEREHTAYGWPFPAVGDRYDLLRDACELLPLMWGPGTPAFQGRTTTVPEAICYPRPLQEHVPILIGGSGERTTLRLVAEHADACNLFGDPDEVARLVGVLHDHCAEVGRDPAAVEVTNLVTILTAPDQATLEQRVAAATPAGRAPERTIASLHAGTVEDHVGLLRRYAEAGVDTVILTMPVIDADRVAELAPLVRAFAGDGVKRAPSATPEANDVALHHGVVGNHTDMTAPIQTIRLISQLALSATWDHLDDDRTHPAQAAREVLELDADLARDLRVQRVVDASPDLDWTGRVALAIHLLLSAQQQPLPAAA